MKNFKRRNTIFLMIGLCLMTAAQAEPQEINHRIRTSLDLGYGKLFNGIENTKVPGGIQFGAGIGYELNREKLILGIGAEFLYLNSKANLMNHVQDMDYLYQHWRPDGTSLEEPILITYHYNFLKYTEKHKVGLINIPVYAGMIFSQRYYATAGVKMGMALMAGYDLKTTVKTTATDPMLVADLEEVGNHFLTTTDFNDKGKLSLGINLAPSIELGIILDEWINKRFLQMNNNRRTQLSYRVGIVADYSILNMNKVSTNRPLFTDPAATPLDINMNGMLESSMAKDKNTGNFFIGAKFSVLFKMNKEKQKNKRTPPPPRQPRAQPLTFHGKIVDAETKENIHAALTITKQPENRQVFKGMPNKRTGIISRRLTAGNYDLSVSIEGYMNFKQSIELNQTDTFIMPLEKIVVHEPIIMQNLLFELNSAVIDTVSEPVLDELAQKLIMNPQVDIQFIGHTDNTGQADYNQKLSEDRAKAVYQAMINRGVEPERMKFQGKGDKQPIDTNDTEEGRAKNRRVEFFFIEK